MNCCINCFSDQGLKSRIEAQSHQRGNCDFCESKNINTISCQELSGLFEQLFELYENAPNAAKSLKINKPFLLHEHLKTFWPKLFNEQLLKSREVKLLVNQIGREGPAYNKALFEEPIELRLFLDADHDNDDNLELQWDSFAEDIKSNNRFFINEKLDLEVLESTLLRFAKTYPADHVFYRARISEALLAKEDMGKPPANKTTPGRANPIGIPYLYVSESEGTTLYETRISLHESITIGQFKLRKSLQVISLKNIRHYGPFGVQDLGFDLEEFIRYRPYLLKLEDELSKPVRKQDVHLDYLPTQFLCEYIKSKGFDAIEYRSAMNPTGYNLAIFNDQHVECMDVKFYNITNLKYKWT